MRFWQFFSFNWPPLFRMPPAQSESDRWESSSLIDRRSCQMNHWFVFISEICPILGPKRRQREEANETEILSMESIANRQSNWRKLKNFTMAKTEAIDDAAAE